MEQEIPVGQVLGILVIITVLFFFFLILLILVVHPLQNLLHLCLALGTKIVTQ